MNFVQDACLQVQKLQTEMKNSLERARSTAEQDSIRETKRLRSEHPGLAQNNDLIATKAALRNQNQELITEKQAHLAMLIQKENIIKESENAFKDQLEKANQELIAEKQAQLELLDQKEKTLKESECNVPVLKKAAK